MRGEDFIMGRRNSLKLARGYAPPKTRRLCTVTTRARAVTGNLCRRDCVTRSFPAPWVVSFLELCRVAHGDRPRYNIGIVLLEKKIAAFAIVNRALALQLTARSKLTVATRSLTKSLCPMDRDDFAIKKRERD